MIRGFIPALLLGASAHAETMTALNPPFIPMNTTVAGLPACTAANTGVVYRVTDALTPVLNIAVVGGGAVAVIARCNGTNFLVGQ